MPHQVGPWHRVPRDLNVLKLPSTGAGTLPQAQVSQPCRPAPSRTRGKLRHAHGLTFQDIPGSAMVTAPAVPGVPVPNNAGPIAVPLLRFAAATVPSDCDNSANAPATTTPPSKPAALWAVMAMTSDEGEEHWSSFYCVQCGITLCMPSSVHNRDCWEHQLHCDETAIRRLKHTRTG
eukprot:jgi/Tetstr1/422950/TSEL_013729.t1